MDVEDVHLDSDDAPVVGGEELVGEEVEEEDQQEAVYDDASLSQWFEANVNEVVDLCEIHSLLRLETISLSLPPVPRIQSLSAPTFHRLSEEYGPSQPLVSHTIEESSEPLGVLVDAAVYAENVEKGNSPKTAQQFLPERQLKLPPVCRSPYINKKTLVDASVSGSEFSLSMEMFSMLEDPDEIVFQTQDGAVTVHRLTLESMCPTLYVEASVIDLWSFLLNCEEKYKNPEALSRFFFTSSVINSDWFDDKKMSKDQKFDLFESNVSALIGDDIDKMSFKYVDMVFFPIIIYNHFYVLVFDLRVPSLSIIDNTANVSNFIFRYKKVCNLVQYVFGKHLEMYHHRMGGQIESLKPYSMKMPWRTRKE